MVPYRDQSLCSPSAGHSVTNSGGEAKPKFISGGLIVYLNRDLLGSTHLTLTLAGLKGAMKIASCYYSLIW